MIDIAYRQTCQLQGGYSVEFSLSGSQLTCAWAPDVPKGKRARKLLPEYRAARGQFIASLGIPAMVVEL